MDRVGSAPSDRTLLALGTAHLDSGDFDQASAILVQALEATPDDTNVLIQLGKLALLVWMPGDARTFLGEAIANRDGGREKAEALRCALAADGRAAAAAIVRGLLESGPADVAPASAEAGDGDGDTGAENLRQRYETYRDRAMLMIEAGRRNELRLAPDELWVGITNNCNLRCVGCYFEGKFTKSYVRPEDVLRAIQSDTPIRQISLTSYGEALLHPQLCEIIELCRATHPSAKLWLISNGTVPITGRRQKAVSMLDKIGLSIDGATKATYESIRLGASFEKFVENARRVVDLRRETGSPQEITFAFTATATNLHELAGVVRLASELGVTDVWAQSMEVTNDEVGRKISDILIDTLPADRRVELIDEARAEARRLNMPFYFSAGLYPSDAEAAGARGGASEDFDVRLCQYPWREPPQIALVEGGYVVIPCCYIVPTSIDLLGDRHGLRFESLEPMNEVYNSAAFWQFREDLMEGRTRDVCGQCHAARGYAWVPPA